MPDYFIATYRPKEWALEDLIVVPGHFITLDRIRARAPLASAHPRAGHVLSTIDLKDLPVEAAVSIVTKGLVRTQRDVRAEYRRFSFLRSESANGASWLTAVLQELRKFRRPGENFRQMAFYEFAEARLQLKFPSNRHVRPKIRQQLQVLVENGIVSREAPGHYHIL